MSDWQSDSGQSDWNRSGDDVPAPPPGPGGGYDGGFGSGSAPAAGGVGGLAGTGPAPDALAGFWIRFAGALVDGLLLGIVGGILGAIVDGGSWFSFLLGAAYFTYFHASEAGQTVGNRVVGIRVLSEDDGRSLDYVRAFLRFLMSYVSAFALVIGYLWMLWDAKNQTWHDKVARSLVVKVSHYPTSAGLGQPSS